jgi:copper transport protein
MIGAGVALALSGHASTAAPQIMMRPAVFVHAVSVAFWIGALLPLAVVLRDPQAVPALLRFSRVIPWTVAALLASGAVLAVVQVQQPAALATTAYGRILSAKVGLVLLLLALAAWNRFRATPAIRADVAGARRRLQRTILAELILVMCIFGLVASWRFTPPPRALAAAAAQPTQLHIHAAEAMADIRFEPGHAGIVRASIVIMTGDFGSLDAKEVQLSIARSPTRRPASRRSRVLRGGTATASGASSNSRSHKAVNGTCSWIFSSTTFARSFSMDTWNCAAPSPILAL